MKCPNCGAGASGKFCSACGAPLSGATCASCQAALSPGAKFCHACGTPTGGGGRSAPGGRQGTTPWFVAGGAVVALLAVLAITQLKPGASPTPASPPATTAGPMDLASLTPRQAADRLFERVMAADERGARDTAQFFAPMALRAYEMVGTLDEDARYHVGLINLVVGDQAAAMAQADSIVATAPRHLFAPILRARVATERGDAAARRRAEQAFLDNYEAEVASNRDEYRLHGGLLERYRQELLAARGTPK